MIQVDPGTLVIYADIGCPWAHLAMHRMHETRARLDLVGSVAFDVRAFPLELINEQPTPKLTLDAEVAVVGTLEPEAGWQLWQEPEYTYPVTTLPALEAVEAAKEQGLRASEQLDRALRRAFFGESRCVSMRHVLYEVAARCDDVDAGKLIAALDEGRCRTTVTEQWQVAASDEVQGSPEVFAPDGTKAHNPGISMHWEGEHGKGFPVIDDDRPQIYEELLRKGAAR